MTYWELLKVVSKWVKGGIYLEDFLSEMQGGNLLLIILGEEKE